MSFVIGLAQASDRLQPTSQPHPFAPKERSNHVNNIHKTSSIARGKMPIRRIENISSRQVTFSKRKNGLLKKAYELSVLCDAEVAAIIFSTSGRLHEYSSSSMRRIIQRYTKYGGEMQEYGVSAQETERWRQQAAKLREQLSLLENEHRHMMGQNLAGLSLKDLQNLERKLEIGSNRVEARKTQLLMEGVQNLCKKEHLLFQQNEMLRTKVFQLSSMQGNTTLAINCQDCQDSSSVEAASKAQSNIIPTETTLQLGTN